MLRSALGYPSLIVLSTITPSKNITEQMVYMGTATELTGLIGVVGLTLNIVCQVSITTEQVMYTKPKSQSNSGLFCELCTYSVCIRQTAFRAILPSYLSIAWNINFYTPSQEHEETANGRQQSVFSLDYSIRTTRSK